MRPLAILLAAVFALSGAPVSAAPSPPPASAARADALLALCRLWNAVRFSHPGVAGETDARWDDALIAAVPAVERDPAALRDAASAMLATLHDPLTRLSAPKPVGGGVIAGGGSPGAANTAEAVPRAEDRDGVRVVRVNGSPAADATRWSKALGDALTVPAGGRALVADLRTATMPSVEQIGNAEESWSQAPFVAHLITAPLTIAPAAHRYFLGFPAESGDNGTYTEGRETEGNGRVVTAASDGRAIPIAFVIDAHAVVPSEALALARAGRAVMFSADGTTGVLPGDAAPFDAGAGLAVDLRTSAPLDVPSIRTGTLDDALAWVRGAQSGAAPARVAPVQAQAAPMSVPIAKRYADASLPDDAHRVLAVFRLWGTVAYLFPYRDLMQDDWDAALRAALGDMRDAHTALDYGLALEKMYAHIHDTHGYLKTPAISEAFAAGPPFAVADVQHQPVIVSVDADAAKRDGFAAGDVVEAIDGETFAARAGRLRPYIVASTEQSVRHQLESNVGRVGVFAGPNGSTMVLRLRGASGRSREVRVVRTVKQVFENRTRPAVDVLPGNVGYIDLERLQPSGVDEALKRLAGTRAIVFDLRGYPRGTAWALGPHFTDHEVRAALFRTPVRREYPVAAGGSRTQNVIFRDETRDFYQLVQPAAPRVVKPVAVVTDIRAISQSEHTALYLAATAHARFVGEPTTGANGDVTNFYLPGGVFAYFSGQAVLHPDGKQLQRVGIVPDVPVSRTLRGVRAGDDELLAAALREALRMSGADTATTRTALARETALEHVAAFTRARPAPPPSVAAAGAPPLPDTGFRSPNPDYEGGSDPSVTHRDGRTIVLRSRASAPAGGYGAYLETITADPYRGKRVRVSGFLRSEAADSASFWLRVDGPSGMEAFDNMNDRALTGTREWTPFAIVLDVPADAKSLVTGLLLIGRGSLWADDLRLDLVPDTVPTTAH